MRAKPMTFRWASIKLRSAVSALAKASGRTLTNYINHVLDEHVKSKKQ